MLEQEILDGAIALIEYGWTRGQLARDENGLRIDPESKFAVARCPLGAITAAARELGVTMRPDGGLSEVGQAAWKVERALELVLIRRGHREGIPYWNDHLAANVEEVLTMMRAARRRLQDADLRPTFSRYEGYSISEGFQMIPSNPSPDAFVKAAKAHADLLAVLRNAHAALSHFEADGVAAKVLASHADEVEATLSPADEAALLAPARDPVLA